MEKHAISSQMPGVGNARAVSRRAQVICSTPKRSSTARRSLISQISRSSMRFSGLRSPGMSPVSLTTSCARENFSDADDFEEGSFLKKSPQRPTRIPGNKSRMEQHEGVQTRQRVAEIKQAMPKWGVSQSQRKLLYEPLVIVSNEEVIAEMTKRGMICNNLKNTHAGVSSSVYRNSVRGSDCESESLDSGKGASENQVSVPSAMSSGPRVHEYGSHPRAGISVQKKNDQRKTKFSNYDSGMEERQAVPKESVLDLMSSIQWKSGRTCYEPLVIALSDDEDNDAVSKKKGNHKKMPAEKRNTNSIKTGGARRTKEIIVHASFDDYEDDFEEERNQSMNAGDTEDEINWGREEEQGEAYSSGDESYESVHSHEAVRLRLGSSGICNESVAAEDEFNESLYSDEDEVLSGSSVFIRNDSAREREERFYDRGRYPSVVRKSRQMSSYGYDDEEEDKFEDSVECDVSGPCMESSYRILADDASSDGEMQDQMNTSGPITRRSVILHSQSTEESYKRNSVKGKPGKSYVMQNSPTDGEENLARVSGKKPRKAPQKKKKSSPADVQEGSVKRKRGRPVSMKPGEAVSEPPKKRGRKKKPKSQESSDTSPNQKTSEGEGPPMAKKTNEGVSEPSKKRGRKKKPKSQESSDTSPDQKTSEGEGPPTAKKTKYSKGEDIAGKRKSLHNPNASQDLSLNNQQSSSLSKDGSQHPFPVSPRIVRKKSAESSSDYLRKKVLTMKLCKSFLPHSSMEEQIVTSTPVKPVTSRIALSSSAKEPDAEIVFIGNAEKDETERTVKESLERRISIIVEEDSMKDVAVKNVEECKVDKINEEPAMEDEAEKTSANVKVAEERPLNEENGSNYVKEVPTEGKENAETLVNKISKTTCMNGEKFIVNKILSEWPVDEICSSSNEKLKQPVSKPKKVKALINGKEKEIEAFVEYSQIKFHKHKTQNIQYGSAVNAPSYGSGFVHLAPGSDKGASVAKQCNFIYLVLGGLVEVKIYNDTERLCKPGDFIVIPKGTKYDMTGRGDTVSALVYFKCQGTEVL